ncbi:hypothetical protein AC77_1884 [Escherichia coli 5-366-08_S4_C1]|nr:hypothetical protein AC77_1884 [Escherichia coli 5-366-08_S4_C1]
MQLQQKLPLLIFSLYALFLNYYKKMMSLRDKYSSNQCDYFKM